MKPVILFDLDGTLLPMDQDNFVGGYFGLLAKKLAPLGYTLKEVSDTIWRGTAAMIQNDGRRTNEEVFWATVAQTPKGADFLRDQALFDEFYQNEFLMARSFCGFAPEAAATVRRLKAAGVTVALATNPFFPRTATEARIRWAGLAPEDFALYTTYETSRYCKPNPAYFLEVAERLGVAPASCLMVGNDTEDDLAASLVGMRVFLLTPCLINGKQKDITALPHGDFAALNAYLDAQIAADAEKSR